MKNILNVKSENFLPRTNVSIIVTASISSDPSAIGTKTLLVSEDMEQEDFNLLFKTLPGLNA